MVSPKTAVLIDRTVGRWIYPAHRFIYEKTNGRVGHRSPQGPMMLLTTTGRKSGLERTTPLLYMPEGTDFVVVASNGGRDNPPAWLLNVKSDPNVKVRAGRRHVHGTAKVLTGDEAAAVWPKLDEMYAGWSHYKTLTDRDIPVIRITAGQPV